MRTIKWSRASQSQDPKNPLADLHQDDERWYLDTLVAMLEETSNQAQLKDDFVFEHVVKRRPKLLHKGKRGPNSILSTVTGLFANYMNNSKKYGQCRLSQKQREDFEFLCMFFAALGDHQTVEYQFEQIQWQETLFAQGGTQF